MKENVVFVGVTLMNPVWIHPCCLVQFGTDIIVFPSSVLLFSSPFSPTMAPVAAHLSVSLFPTPIRCIFHIKLIVAYFPSLNGVKYPRLTANHLMQVRLTFHQQGIDYLLADYFRHLS